MKTFLTVIITFILTIATLVTIVYTVDIPDPPHIAEYPEELVTIFDGMTVEYLDIEEYEEDDLNTFGRVNGEAVISVYEREYECITVMAVGEYGVIMVELYWNSHLFTDDDWQIYSISTIDFTGDMRELTFEDEYIAVPIVPSEFYEELLDMEYEDWHAFLEDVGFFDYVPVG